MTEEEINKRKVTFDEITETAKEKIEKGFRGKAVVAFIDLLGFSAKIRSEWDDPKKDPLLTLMELKSFLELAAKNAKTIRFNDYDEETIIEEVKYPKVITVSDSFMLLLPLNETNEQTILASILAVASFSLELWRICIDKGFTVRGGIQYGNIYYNDLDIVGNAFMDAYYLESKIASNSRIILSHEIKSIIDKNVDSVHASFKDYFLRFFYVDKDDYLAINPTMILAHKPEIAEESMDKINDIVSKVTIQKNRSKYDDLIEFVKNQNLELQDRSMYKMNTTGNK